MNDPKSPRYFPRPETAAPASTPEVSPPPGDLPKKFPEKQPLSDDGLEAAKNSASAPPRVGSGEDPAIESGALPSDPERTTSSGDEEPL